MIVMFQKKYLQNKKGKAIEKKCALPYSKILLLSHIMIIKSNHLCEKNQL